MVFGHMKSAKETIILDMLPCILMVIFMFNMINKRIKKFKKFMNKFLVVKIIFNLLKSL